MAVKAHQVKIMKNKWTIIANNASVPTKASNFSSSFRSIFIEKLSDCLVAFLAYVFLVQAISNSLKN